MFSNSSFGAPTGFSAMFIIVPIIMICLLLYRYFIKGPQKKEEARRRKDQAICGESLSFLRTNKKNF
jgi:amino acid transporter